MPSSPSVSVILPTFNRADYLAEAITSVLTQTELPREFVVVDDGSTDDTRDVVARFGDAVTYIHQPNAGKLGAISTGLDHVTGDLVWIMDDDDIAPPDAIRSLAAPFAEPPLAPPPADAPIVMTYGRMTKFSGAGQTLSETEVHYPDDPRPFLLRLLESCFITGHPCVMVRRSALDAVRPFDPAILASDDFYLHLHVAMQGAVVAVDDVVLRQRQHDGLRGPIADRYAESERIAKWIAHDAYIIDGVISKLPLSAYLVPPALEGNALSPRDRRRALIQRAVIAGRHKLWPQALDDLEAALAIIPDEPLDPATLSVLSGLLGSRYGIDEVLDNPATLDRLQHTALHHPDRIAILAAISRPLLQHIRSGRSVGKSLQSWFHLMDLAATGAALRASARRNLMRIAVRLKSGFRA